MLGFGRFAAEALKEAAFLAVLKKGWEWAKKAMDHYGGPVVVVGKIYEKINSRGKGLLDESYFAQDFTEAIAETAKAFSVTHAEEKARMLVEAFRLVEEADRVNNTTYMKNFRLFVVLRDPETDTVGKPAVPGKPAVLARPARPARMGMPARPAVIGSPAILGTPAVPGMKRPGVEILEGLAKCANSADVVARIAAFGAMQDTSTNFEKFLKFGKMTLWPVVSQKSKNGAASFQDAIKEMTKSLKEKNDTRQKKPWWKRML